MELKDFFDKIFEDLQDLIENTVLISYDNKISYRIDFKKPVMEKDIFNVILGNKKSNKKPKV